MNDTTKKEIRERWEKAHNPNCPKELWDNCADWWISELSRFDQERVEKVTGETSDGNHTFNELYEHRHALFLNLARFEKGFKSKKHADGSMFEGWFIAGIETPKGMITYHLPEKYWELTQLKKLPIAPEWDGHTSKDVIDRLMSFLTNLTNVFNVEN